MATPTRFSPSWTSRALPTRDGRGSGSERRGPAEEEESHHQGRRSCGQPEGATLGDPSRKEQNGSVQGCHPQGPFPGHPGCVLGVDGEDFRMISRTFASGRSPGGLLQGPGSGSTG